MHRRVVCAVCTTVGRMFWFAWLGVCSVYAKPLDTAVYEFDIPAQPLVKSLNALSSQTKTLVLFPYDLVENLESRPVQGRYTVREALESMLIDTGLVGGISEKGVLTISKMKSENNGHESKQTTGHHEGKRTMKPKKSFLAKAIALLVGAGVAASNSAADESQSNREAQLIEEIIVTARRQEENIQTVPISITVVSQQELDNNNVSTIGDLQYLVPSLSSGSRESRDSISVGIRGQGQNSISGQPGVIVYLNEVPVPANFQGETAGGSGLLFDLENVQTLVGPQGTLFGRNAVGGALLLQTARPEDKFSGNIRLGYGNRNNREIDGVVNIPIVDDKVLTRFAFVKQLRDGFTRILSTPAHPGGVDADARDLWSVRGTLSINPGDLFHNDTIVTYTEYDSNGSPYFIGEIDPNGVVPTFFPSFASLFEQQQSLGKRKVLPTDLNLEVSGSNLSINNLTNLTFSDELKFRNIVGYSVLKQIRVRDVDATILPILAIPDAPFQKAYHQFTEEAQLLGKSFGGRLDWIFGVFYLDQPYPSTFEIEPQTVFGAPGDAAARRSESSKAIFAQANYELAPKWRFTAGVRYTKDKRSIIERGHNLSGVVCTEPPVNCADETRNSASSTATTWTVGLDYQVVPDTLLYLTSRRGYRAGGTNISDVDSSYDPEFVKDIEFGIKSDWRLGEMPVHTNAAVYYQDYTDIQVQQNQFINGAFFVFNANAASAELWGGELEASIWPTENLQLAFNYAYLKFDYKKIGEGVDASQLEATLLTDRPRNKYAVNVRYHLPLDPELGEISVQAKWNWQSKTATNFSDGGGTDSSDEYPSYGLLGLAANWDSIGQSAFDASFFMSNVTNKVYPISGANLMKNLGYTFVQYGEPRMYGVRVRYRFD